MKRKSWFAAKCLFVHRDRGTGPRQLYEERVVLVRARSFSKAGKRAEREAHEYAKDLQNCDYIGYVDVYRLFGRVEDGAEVFSSMRQSDLEPEKYLDCFYPEELEDCEAAGREHRYYNRGEGESACYHCAVVKQGELWS